MTRLSIIPNWHPTESCINVISGKMKSSIDLRQHQIVNNLKYIVSDANSIFVTVEDVWYGHYDDVIAMDQNWFRGVNIADYTGPTFSDWNEIQQTLLKTHPRNTIDILLDGMEVDSLPCWENCYFKKMTETILKPNEVAVYYGGISSMQMTFELDIEKPFDINNLSFIFVDCGKRGYVLDCIKYEVEEMEKDYTPFKDMFFIVEFYRQ